MQTANSDRTEGGPVERRLWMFHPIISLATTITAAALIWHLLYTRPRAPGGVGGAGRSVPGRRRYVPHFTLGKTEAPRDSGPFSRLPEPTLPSFLQPPFMSAYCAPGPPPCPPASLTPRAARGAQGSQDLPRWGPQQGAAEAAGLCQQRETEGERERGRERTLTRPESQLRRDLQGAGPGAGAPPPQRREGQRHRDIQTETQRQRHTARLCLLQEGLRAQEATGGGGHTGSTHLPRPGQTARGKWPHTQARSPCCAALGRPWPSLVSASPLPALRCWGTPDPDRAPHPRPRPRHLLLPPRLAPSEARSEARALSQPRSPFPPGERAVRSGGLERDEGRNEGRMNEGGRRPGPGPACGPGESWAPGPRGIWPQTRNK